MHIDRVERRADGFHVFAGGETTLVRFAQPGVVRCPVARLPGNGLDFEAWPYTREAPSFDEDARELRAVGRGIVVALDKRTGRLRFLAPDGATRITEDDALPL